MEAPDKGTRSFTDIKTDEHAPNRSLSRQEKWALLQKKDAEANKRKEDIEQKAQIAAWTRKCEPVRTAVSCDQCSRIYANDTKLCAHMSNGMCENR